MYGIFHLLAARRKATHALVHKRAAGAQTLGWMRTALECTITGGFHYCLYTLFSNKIDFIDFERALSFYPLYLEI